MLEVKEVDLCEFRLLERERKSIVPEDFDWHGLSPQRWMGVPALTASGILALVLSAPGVGPLFLPTLRAEYLQHHWEASLGHKKGPADGFF